MFNLKYVFLFSFLFNSLTLTAAECTRRIKQFKNVSIAKDQDHENLLLMKLKSGTVQIKLMDDLAPLHVKRIKTLARNGDLDEVVFHRVISGFMAQTGDVQYGKMGSSNYNLQKAGTGGSSMPDVKAEFSQTPHARGTVGAARSQNPNSFNSQFFINFKENSFLNGKYTVFGRVFDGMSLIDSVAVGEPPSRPDRMKAVIVASDLKSCSK